jgi:hypothetical protein
MQGHIHQHLVEGAVHERRVDRDDRVQSAEGEARRGGHGVLLGDADVVDAVGEALRERLQARRAQHRRRDRDDVVATLSGRDECVGESVGPGDGIRGAQRLARRRVDLADGVELIGLVVAGGLVAAALLGDDVHDHRGTVVLRQLQRLLQRDEVVPVDRTEVLDVEVRVQRLVVREAREEAVRAAAHTAVDGATHRPEAAEEDASSCAGSRTLGGAHPVQVARHAADRRRVGAPVVVDDDDEVAIVVVGDVVERLPGHPAGERAVADDRDDVVVLASGARQGARCRPPS